MKIIVEVQIYPGRQNPAGIRDVRKRVLTGGGIPAQIRAGTESCGREGAAGSSLGSLSWARGDPA